MRNANTREIMRLAVSVGVLVGTTFLGWNGTVDAQAVVVIYTAILGHVFVESAAQKAGEQLKDVLHERSTTNATTSPQSTTPTP